MVTSSTNAGTEDGQGHGQGQAQGQAPDEECLISVSGALLYLDWQHISTGVVSIRKSLLSWHDTEKNIGFSLTYPSISLHAIRNEPFAGLYAMLDHKLQLPAGLALPVPVQSAQEENESDDESLSEAYTELMFQPPDSSLINRMYTAMNECQALHPDPNDSDDSEDIDEDEEFDPHDCEPEAMDVAEEDFQGLQIEGSNNHPPHNGNSHDPDQFADD